MAMDNVKWGPFKTELRTSGFMVLVICEFSSTPRLPIEFWMRFWMASRLCCCGFHSGYYRLGSRWTWTTACSNLLRIWIGKNYVIFFSIQIIVSLWCILLFCLLHDCEILHRNEVFSDRIEIEKTEVLNLTLCCGKIIIILAPVVCGSQSQDRVT